MTEQANRIKIRKKPEQAKTHQNRALTLIENQGALNHKRGSFGPLGNVAENGCGMIALYNVLKLTGSRISYEKLQTHVRRHWKYVTLCGGLLGTNPLYLLAVLGKLPLKKRSVRLYFGKKEVRAQETPGLLYVNLYFHHHGAHYSVSEWKDGRLRVYNDGTDYSGYPEYYRFAEAKGMLVIEYLLLEHNLAADDGHCTV